MSYTIDVYRQDAPAQKNMVSFGAYVTMFPQLVAGPIVRYRDVAAELNRRTNSMAEFAAGARRFTVGLAKKVLLANSIGALWDAELAAQSAGTLTVFGGWLGIAAFGFQIYFDFSGYSDMAIGMGQMLGFHFPENFAYPYTAASVTEFWRRWHISLTTWFREYLYIPLGGSRKGTWRTVRNIFIVWFCTGFWHGASWNFILWGLHFFLWLMLEKYLLREFFAEAAHVAAARVYPAGGVHRVGGVCHGGSDCLRPILQNLLWRRDALERGGRLLPDGLWPDAGDSGSRLYPLGEERLEPAAGTGKRCPWPGADAGGTGGLHGLSGGRQL